jgi:hypothetical protein
MTDPEVRERLRKLDREHYVPFEHTPTAGWVFEWKGCTVTLEWYDSIPGQEWPDGYLVAEITRLFAVRWYLGNIPAEVVPSFLDQVVDRKIAWEEEQVAQYLESVNKPWELVLNIKGEVV